MTTPSHTLRRVAFVWLILVALTFAPCLAVADPGTYWTDDWVVQDGFSIEVDTRGFEFPTAIAFVPDPGPDPKDPLYFVAELRGTIKVVTNDRTVSTFAEDFMDLQPEQELPDSAAALGLTGLCLEPSHGYVFASFIYRTDDGTYYNDVIRFATKPATFSSLPGSSVRFTKAFAQPESGFRKAAGGHQVGGCRVYDGELYVGVGDGHQPYKAQNLDAVLGKVLRMDLDGRPLPDNPFYDASDGVGARDYVWAYGFRNPFGVVTAKGRVFVADNGPSVDRFLEVRRGWNYLYDGTDRSVATNALAVISPGDGVAHVDYYDGRSGLFPESYRSTFFVVVSGDPAERWPDSPPRIVIYDYSLQDGRLERPPATFLRFRHREPQVLVSVAIGPDGLYFAPLFPDERSVTAVFRVRHDPEHEHPFVMAAEHAPRMLMDEYGCLGCHTLAGEGGGAGPPLDRDVLVPKLEERLNSASYEEQVRALNGQDPKFAAAREEVLAAEGTARLRTWLVHRIMHPEFDDPNAQMPALGVTEAEARAITDHLVTSEGWIETIVGHLPRDRLAQLVIAFAAGIIGGVLASTAGGLLVFRLRRRRRPA